MPVYRKKVLTALAAFAAAAAPAQAEEIVVTGKALSKQEADAKAQAYVQAVGMVTTVKPAARWLDRICPKATGLGDPAIAAKVEARLRQIAGEVGARLAKPGCEANLLMIFTANADDLARRINQQDPRQMMETDPKWRGRLIDGRTPIRWWYSSEVRSADGAPPVSAPLPWLGIASDGAADMGSTTNTDIGGDSGGGYTNSRRSSLVSTNAKRAIRTATILVDVTLAQGKELDAVTDYAALVGLAEIRFAGDPPQDSVLSLFTPATPAYGLTAQDQALLKSLYRLPLDRQGRYHRGWLVKDVSKSLTAVE